MITLASSPARDLQAGHAPSSGMPSFEVITSSHAFSGIRRDWDALWAVSSGSVFQHHRWIAAWLDSKAASSCYPSIGLAYRGERLAGAMPFVIRRWHGLRILEWAAQSFSDYCDCLGGPEIIPGLLNHMLARGGFDLVRLKNVRSDARAYAALRSCGFQEDHHDQCLGVYSHWSDGAAWFSTLNKKKKNNHRRGLRILGEEGPVDFRVLAEPSWVPVVDVLVRLKAQWLAATKMRSDLLEAGIVRDLVAAMENAGCLRVFTLECGGTIAAGLVGILQRDQLLAFFAAYDPTFERCSPGILLMTECTMWAFDRGMRLVDYLRGEESYKYEFANHALSLTHFVGGVNLMGRSATLGRNVLATRAPTKQPEIGAAYVTAGGTPRQVR